ncbi:hypothetical protein H0H93_016570 [Arthromyces matolae]|nr:hypothetical protein H0H93_016570 [Arthromyces matolae]
MSNPSSPKPSYATVVASPAGNRSRSPSPGAYRPTIRIPALGRLIQAKPAPKKSQPPSPEAPAQPIEGNDKNLQDALGDKNLKTPPIPTPLSLQPVENKASTSLVAQTPTPQKLTKQEKAKAKRARQAARKAKTVATAADETARAQEDADHRDLPLIERIQFPLNEVEGSNGGNSPASTAPSTPRLTAAAKGKGRAIPINENFFTMHTLDFAEGGEGPPPNNKRKANESPAVKKTIKKNTGSANPPLLTPIRLTIQSKATTTSEPDDDNESKLLKNASLLMHSPKRHIPSLLNRNTTSTPYQNEGAHSPPNNSYLAVDQPSAEELERNIMDHIKMKPSFCGTEIEFNERTMRLQELLVASIIADQANMPTPRVEESTSAYRLPPPRQSSAHSSFARREEPGTPTPSQRLDDPTPSYPRRAHSSLGIPQAHRRYNPGTPYPHAPTSDQHDYLPPVSPRSFDDDNISMIDSKTWPHANDPFPAPSIWEEDNVPPPYANSQRNSPPRQYSPPPQANVHRNRNRTTSTNDKDEAHYRDENMQVDNPKNTWEPAETHGVVVNRVGLEKTERPPNGWPRPKMRSRPTEDLIEESLIEINNAPPHALWFLEHCTDNNPLREQSIVDAIRAVCDQLITIPRGKRVGVIFPTHKSSNKKTSRFAKPHLYLITNITPEQSAELATHQVISTKDLTFWLYAKHFPKSHFGGTIAGLHHTEKDHEEVRETVIEELLHKDRMELARYVTHNSLPYDREAYHTLVANLQVEFVNIDHNLNKPSFRAWNLILPPNNLNDQSTIEFIGMLSKVKIRTDGAGLGRFLDLHEIPVCEGCKGLGHYYSKCPYNDIPGWFGEKPESTAEKAQPKPEPATGGEGEGAAPPRPEPEAHAKAILHEEEEEMAEETATTLASHKISHTDPALM